MEFEWDETKARANLEKHGIDFQGAIAIFETEPVLEVRSERSGEERWKAIGVVDGVMLTVVYTWRAGRRRMISARRANRNEKRTYHEANAGGSKEG
jgi:uncharacterized DUF497 family protein